MKKSFIGITLTTTWLLMLLCSFCLAEPSDKPVTQVVAHRGYWDTEGSAQNSIASLRKSQEINVYGSEFDVQMTCDSQLIVLHDIHHGEIEDIRQATYSAIVQVPLPNGEPVPLLADYLDAGAENKNVKLILEIKSHLSPEHETTMVEKIVALVAEKGVEEQVEYIAFSFHICKELLRINPTASVAYLSGDISPAQVRNHGLTGIDYHYSKYIQNPEWIKEAHDNGMTVNVWTVNHEEDIRNAIYRGVDFISTDNPLLVQKIIAEISNKE